MNLGEYAVLTVVSVEDIGTFLDGRLDGGDEKDLFLPHAERTRDLQPGDEAVIYTYVDKSDRVSASMRLERNKEKTNVGLQNGQKADLIIYAKTDLGYKATVNGQSLGVLFHNEVFQPLHYGQTIQGYIKLIREDDRIDLILQQPGHQAALNDIAPKILKLLEDNGGFFAINDKTDAERIYDLFGVSKNKYKMALGGLYKSQLITVAKEGISLVKKTKP